MAPFQSCVVAPKVAGGDLRSPKRKPRQNQPQNVVGRPRKAAAPERSLETPNTVLEQGFGGRPEFLAAQKDWAATLLPDRRIAVRHQWYDYNKGYKLFLWCNSCTKCATRGGWSAYCTYNLVDRTLSRCYTPSNAHGSFDQVRKWNELTAQTEHALKEHMKHNRNVFTQDLLSIVEKHQPERPIDEKFLLVWRKKP